MKSPLLQILGRIDPNQHAFISSFERPPEEGHPTAALINASLVGSDLLRWRAAGQPIHGRAAAAAREALCAACSDRICAACWRTQINRWLSTQDCPLGLWPKEISSLNINQPTNQPTMNRKKQNLLLILALAALAPALLRGVEVSSRTLPRPEKVTVNYYSTQPGVPPMPWPPAGGLTTVHNFKPPVGDTVQTWGPTGWSYPNEYLNDTEGWAEGEPTLAVGEAFLVHHLGTTNVNWTRTFTVP